MKTAIDDCELVDIVHCLLKASEVCETDAFAASAGLFRLNRHSAYTSDDLSRPARIRRLPGPGDGVPRCRHGSRQAHGPAEAVVQAMTPARANNASELVVIDEVVGLCRRLRLKYVREQLPDVALTARAQRWDPAEALRVLLVAEVEGRDRSTIESRRHRAHFPAGKSWGTATVSAVPSVRRDRCEAPSVRTVSRINRYASRLGRTLRPSPRTSRNPSDGSPRRPTSRSVNAVATSLAQTAKAVGLR